MVMANNSKYKAISDHISTICCTDEQLQYLKSKYMGIIRSKRRCEQIKALSDLVHILIKRDCVNPKKVEPILEIAIYIQDFDLIKLITGYNSGNNNGEIDDNRMSNQNLTYTYYCNHELPVLPQVPRDMKDKVYLCIASNIGQKWIDLARAIQVPEGDIDELNFTMNSPQRIYKILRYHEQNCDPRFWKSKLLEALSVARRNDLRQKIQKIFDVAHVT